ncbi:hypothetical protein IAU60_000652 [Kwoniella sp. DSM 27419]
MPPHTISPTMSSQGLGISYSTLSPPPDQQRLTGMVPQRPSASTSPSRLPPAHSLHLQTALAQGSGSSPTRSQPLLQPTFSLRPTHTRQSSSKGFNSFSALPPNGVRPMGPRPAAAFSPRIGGPSGVSDVGHNQADSVEGHDVNEQASQEGYEEETPKQHLRPLPISPSRSGSVASHFTTSSKHSRRTKSSEMLRKYSKSEDTFGAATRTDKYLRLSGEDDQESPHVKEPLHTHIQSSPAATLPYPRPQSTESFNAVASSSSSGSASHHQSSPSKRSARSQQTTHSDGSYTNFSARSFPVPPSHPPRSATTHSDPTHGIPFGSDYPSRPFVGMGRSMSQPQHLFAVPEMPHHHFDTDRDVQGSGRPDFSSKRVSDISSGVHSKNAALLSAENGSMMLAFSPTGDGTFRAGEMICGGGTGLLPSPASPPVHEMGVATDPDEDLKSRPWSESSMSHHARQPSMLGHRGRSLSDGAQLLARQGTLLHPASSNQRASAELGVLLGGPRSRRLSQGKLLPPPPTEIDQTQTDWEKSNKVRLEAAKKGKARVEVDVVLERECVVEGGEVRGRMEVRITGGKRGEGLRVGGGKIRVVGFEELSTSSRHIFYHQPHPLPVFDPSIQHNLSSSLFASGPDSDGYRLAAEGTHSIPFRMRLPLGGGAKGTYTPPNGKGACVRYVVVGSVKIHVPSTGKRSIAHFYRSIVVLPYLNPSLVLAPSQEPVEGYVERGLGWNLTGEKGRVELRVALGRRFWVSGQRLWCEVAVRNDSNRKIKTLNLALLQTVQVFTPQPVLDTADLPTRLMKSRRTINNCTGVAAIPGTPDLDACQTTTHRKKISEESIEADFTGHGAGRVTGKGWWTGVDSGESGHWDMSLLVPPGHLSIRRTRLVEVQYTLRVTVNNSIYVDVPIQLINFLSIDPPPMPRDGPSLLTAPLASKQSVRHDRPQDLQVSITGSGVYQQARPLNARTRSDYSHDSAVGPARASSTTLHIDALLQAGRARAEVEAMGHMPPLAEASRPRPLSLGSSYSVSKPEPPSMLGRIKSNPQLRPKGARMMSQGATGPTDTQSVFSGEEIDEDEEEDHESLEDKTARAARYAMGRQRSLAAIHRAMDREQRELDERAQDGSDEVLRSPDVDSPPEGEYRPCHTPNEELYEMAGDTPQVSERSNAATPLPVSSLIERMEDAKIVEGDEELEDGTASAHHDSEERDHAPIAQPRLEQESQDDAEISSVLDPVEEYSDSGHTHIAEEIGNETILADMVPEERQELHELMSQHDHEEETQGYDYGEDVEIDYEPEGLDRADRLGQGLTHSTSAGRLPFLPGSLGRSRDQHIDQTRSAYGSFAASAVSEQESEVGQVFEAVKRNISIKVPSRLLPLPTVGNEVQPMQPVTAEEDRIEGDATPAPETAPTPPKRPSSVSHSLLAGARRASQNLEAAKRESLNSGRPSLTGQNTSPRKGSALSLAARLEAAVSSLRPEDPSNMASSPRHRLIQKDSSFSMGSGTLGSALKVNIPSSTSSISYESPRRYITPGVSPKSFAPATFDLARQYSVSSHLRNEVLPAAGSQESTDASGDEGHPPGLAPSIASDSASSEDHALDSPNPVESPYVSTSPPTPSARRTLPSAPLSASAYQPFPTLLHEQIPEGKVMFESSWAPGPQYLHTQVHYARHQSAVSLSPTAMAPTGSHSRATSLSRVASLSRMSSMTDVRRKSSAPIPIDDVSLLPSPASSPSSCHSILPSVRTKIEQLNSREEALRKFSVSGSVNPQASPIQSSPTASPSAKRRSYTTALAPRPVRSASDDSYAAGLISTGATGRQPAREGSAHGYSPAGQVGHTTYIPRRQFADRDASQGWLEGHRPMSNYYATDSMRSKTSNGSITALSPRSLTAPKLDPFGLGFGSGAVALDMSHLREEEEYGQSGELERHASIRSTSTTATDIERALIDGQMARPPVRGEDASAQGPVMGLKSKPSGHWEFSQQRYDGSAHHGVDGRVSISEGESSESEGLR